jgi:hypothetical protein
VGENPKGYAVDKRFHWRFEGEFVQARIKFTDLQPLIAGQPKTFKNLRTEIIAYLKASHAEVERLYELDKVVALDSLNNTVDARQFAAVRLAAGAEMLRDLWWTAWATSWEPGGGQGP